MVPFVARAQVQQPASVAPSQSSSPPTGTQGQQLGGTIEAELSGLGFGRSSISVRMPDGTEFKNLPLRIAADRGKLVDAKSGDRIKFDVDDVSAPTAVTNVEKVMRAVSVSARMVALAISVGILAGIAAAFTRGRPQHFLIGIDNRYSNSQVQLVLWFAAVAAAYLATVGLRVAYLGWDFVGGVSITENLLALSGLSALTFGGAKVITVSKIEAATQAGMLSPKGPAAQPRLQTDLVQNDSGRADLGDFQMILITVTAVLLFALSSFHFLGALELATPVQLPDVDSTLLSVFGLGQGAYLIKKAATKVGEG
jgi:succinate dehydrogenase hydrophobic anchor subunit